MWVNGTDRLLGGRRSCHLCHRCDGPHPWPFWVGLSTYFPRLTSTTVGPWPKICRLQWRQALRHRRARGSHPPSVGFKTRMPPSGPGRPQLFSRASCLDQFPVRSPAELGWLEAWSSWWMSWGWGQYFCLLLSLCDRGFGFEPWRGAELWHLEWIELRFGHTNLCC